MKNVRIKNKRVDFRSAGVLILSAFIVSFCAFTVPKMGKGFHKTALFCAGLAMPKNSAEVFIKDIEKKSSLPQNNSNSKTESKEDVKSALKPASDSKRETLAPAIKTPDDVALITQEAKQTLAGNSRDGNISERKFDSGSATHVFENVTVKNTTKTQQSIDISGLLNDGLELVIEDKSKPSVLIYHTHATESYELLDRGWYSNSFPPRSNDENLSVVRVGTEIVSRLRAAGFNVIHDKTIYDTTYSGAYDRSEAGIRQAMKDNPSIKVTLDVHRDGIQTDGGLKLKPTADIGGKKAAQIMIITGCEEQGIVDYANWQQNLKFALNLQRYAENLSSGLMRPVFFCARKYNMNVTPWSLLLEMGSDSNTLEEAVYSGALIGDSLAQLLEQCVKK